MKFLTVTQASFLSGFHYKAHDANGHFLADLLWPDFAQARNARLAVHKRGSDKGDVKIRLASNEVWRISFDYLTRAYANDTRFTLHQGAEAAAACDVIFPGAKLRKPDLVITQPFQGRLLRANRWARMRYLLEREGQVAGHIEEPHRLSLTRTLQAHLPDDLALPQQLFFVFIMINAAWR